MTVEDPTKKQIQEVDPEVAKILGLEDNFDLEYDEYLTLLKEALVKYAVIGKEKDSAEKAQVLNEERKRIKGLKGSKFTAPKKAVNTDSFFGRKKEETTQKPITDTAKLLPGTVGAGPIQKYKSPEEPKQEEEKKDDTSDKLKEIDNFLNGSLLGIVKEIRGLTEDILSILQKQFSAEKKGAELFRRESEKKGKVGKEKELETKEEKKGLGLVEKITKPFTSIFDTIKNFITMVLLGSLVNWLLSVIENPMILLKPIQGLIDGIVGFFNNIINFIDNLVVQPVRNFIDTINSALNGFIDILNGALKMLPGSPQIGPANIPNIPEPPQIEAPNITGEKKPAEPPKGPPVNLKFTGGSIGPTTQVIQKVTGGLIRPIGPTTQVIQKNSGGGIANKDSWSFNDKVSKEGGKVNSSTTAFNITGLGPDKYLTALGEREYVLKPGAADWLGGPAELDPLNARFGGSSARKTANLGDVKITAMNSGGQVGRPPSSSSLPMGGGHGSYQRPAPATPSSTPSNTPSPSLRTLATNAKTTYYDPSLGGINASGAKTRDGLPATSTGEGYRPNVFSAAAFPPMIAKLPRANLANASGFPGGKTLKRPVNVVVNSPNGKKAVVRVNDVGPGVKGHASNHMLDFSVASKNFLGTGPGYKIEGPTSSQPGPLSGSAAPSTGDNSPSEETSASTDGDNSSIATDSGAGTSGEKVLSAADISYSIKGDAAKESYVTYLSSIPSQSPSTPAPPAAEPTGPKGGRGGPAGGPKPPKNDIGYRVGRGFMGALGDLGPGLLLQLQGKDGPALQRQRERGRKAIQLLTTGRWSEKPNSSRPASRPTPTAQKPLIDPRTGRNVFDGMPAARSAISPSRSTTSSAANAPVASGSIATPSISTATATSTSSPTNTPVSNKIAGGMEIYNKQKSSGDIKGAQETAKSVWALANPTLAAASAERERTRGTQQTDNPLMKDMKSRLPMNSPSVQSADVAKLGSGFQSLVQNPNAFKAADSKSKEPNTSRTLIRGVEPPKANSPAPPTPPPGAPGASTSSQPTTPLVPPAPTLPPPTQLNQDLTQMSIEQLSKMLDPTVTGASNPAVFRAAAKAREEGKAQGLIGEALEKKVLIATIQAKQGSLSATASTAAPSPIASSSITATTKPNIPQPPSTQPNVSMMPLPPAASSNKPNSTGMSKTGTTPTVYFTSYNDSEPVLVATAALYNIWGM